MGAPISHLLLLCLASLLLLPYTCLQDNNRDGGTETPPSYAAVAASKPAPQNKHSTDDDGFIKITAKRIRQNAPITGNAKSGTLKRVNNNCPFDLFVTRLHPDTTKEDITNYVRAEVGIHASYERLETRYIVTPTHHIKSR